MINAQNLKPIGSPGRTKEEERAIQRSGGIKSGESRRRKRDQRKQMEAMLKCMPELDHAAVDNLHRLGIRGKGEKKDQFTIETIGMAALLQKVMRGDVRAYRLMLEILGEDAFSRREEARLDQEKELAYSDTSGEAVDDGFMEMMEAQAEGAFINGVDEPQNTEDSGV